MITVLCAVGASVEAATYPKPDRLVVIKEMDRVADCGLFLNPICWM